MVATTLNPNISALSAPPIPIVQQAARAYDGSYGALIDLSQAVPGYSTHRNMCTWLSEAAGDPDLMGYGAIEGELVLRQAYSDGLNHLYLSHLGADHVAITAGCNQAFVAAAMGVAAPGEAVLLVTPFYFNHDTSLSMMGVKTRTIDAKPDHGFLPDLEALRGALEIHDDIRAVALVSPNNPTGAIYPPNLLLDVFNLCQRHGVWLILDETYRDFLPNRTDKIHDLFLQPDWENTLISLYSFSKSFCIPGHRLGALTAGPRVIEAIVKIMDNLQICAPRPAQHALAQGLRSLGAWMEGNRAEILNRQTALYGTFEGLMDWHIEAAGAYFAYIRHPFTGLSGMDVAKAMAQNFGITVIPGAFFGANQDNYLRFAFANVSSNEIMTLKERLAMVSL